MGSEVAAGLASNNTGASGGGRRRRRFSDRARDAKPGSRSPERHQFSHTTTPQPITTVSETAALVTAPHLINSFVQEGFLSGGYVQVSANESYLKQNAPSDFLNPSVAPWCRSTLPQFAARLRDRRERPVYPGGSEKSSGALKRRFDHNF